MPPELSQLTCGFWLPGVGKTHALRAVADALVEAWPSSAALAYALV
jgi:hypothetical protein